LKAIKILLVSAIIGLQGCTHSAEHDNKKDALNGFMEGLKNVTPDKTQNPISPMRIGTHDAIQKLKDHYKGIANKPGHKHAEDNLNLLLKSSGQIELNCMGGNIPILGQLIVPLDKNNFYSVNNDSSTYTVHYYHQNNDCVLSKRNYKHFFVKEPTFDEVADLFSIAEQKFEVR
jgi:hypothetical protein